MTKYFSSKHVISLFLMLLLSGCVTTSLMQSNGMPNYAKWQAHKKKLRQIMRYTVSGSIAYFSPKTRNYARFYFDQKTPTCYDLLLTTPLGSPIMSLYVTKDKASLKLNDGRVFARRHPDSLLQDITGLPIPLSELHSWLIGFSDDPHQDIVNDEGYLKSTQLENREGTWRVLVNRYHNTMPIPMPEKIEIMHQNDRIRLTLNTWTL